MTFIDEQLIKFKQLIEEAIVAHGAAGKDSIIRSSVLINLIHDAIKKELIDNHIDCQYKQRDDQEFHHKIHGKLTSIETILVLSLKRKTQFIMYRYLNCMTSKILTYSTSCKTRSIVISCLPNIVDCLWYVICHRSVFRAVDSLFSGIL